MGINWEERDAKSAELTTFANWLASEGPATGDQIDWALIQGADL